jgi:Ras-related protein Rab-6A
MGNNQSASSKRELKFKVIFVGIPRVGKTSIISRVVYNKFRDVTTSTTSVSESFYTTQIGDINVILEIWDAPGQIEPEKYRLNYFRNADAVVMVYDQTKEESYNFIKQIMDKLEHLCDKPLSKVALFIVGNKSDLPITQLQIFFKEAKEFSDRHGATFYQTSAKAMSNINVLFDNIAQETTNIIEKYIIPNEDNPIQNNNP